MFKSEGTFDVVVTRAILGESKFRQGVLDVCIEVKGADGCVDWWRGEWSEEYGKGNAANRQQWELTLGTLKKLGFVGENIFEVNAAGQYVHLQPDADGVVTFPELVGKQTVATVRQSVTDDGKVYYNVRYLGDGGGPKGVTLNQLAAMFGGQPQQAPQPAPAAAGQAPAAAQQAAPQQGGLFVPQSAGQAPAFPAAGQAPANGPFGNLQRR